MEYGPDNKRQEDFFTQWLHISDFDLSITPAFAEQAVRNGIDLKAKHFAVVVDQAHWPNQKLSRYEFSLDQRRHVYVFYGQDQLDVLLTRLDKQAKIGVSNRHFDLFGAVTEALFALCFVNLSLQTSLVKFNEVALFEPMYESNLRYLDFETRLEELDFNQRDHVMLNTLWAYLTEQSGLNTVAKNLSVHRRTVEYRLSRIQELVDLNPRQTVDASILLVCCLRLKTKHLPILMNELRVLSNSMLPRDLTAH